MRSDTAADLARSGNAFERVVWPVFAPKFGQVLPVETDTESPTAVELDQRAGIDYWLLSPTGHMRGLASRVQWCDRSYDTTTVRVERVGGNTTELDKRSRQIDTPGALWPWYTIHAYISHTDHLISAAIVRTLDLIAAALAGIGDERENRLEDRLVRFHAVPWSHFVESGCPIVIASADGTLQIEPGMPPAPVMDLPPTVGDWEQIIDALAGVPFDPPEWMPDPVWHDFETALLRVLAARTNTPKERAA